MSLKTLRSGTSRMYSYTKRDLFNGMDSCGPQASGVPNLMEEAGGSLRRAAFRSTSSLGDQGRGAVQEVRRRSVGDSSCLGKVSLWFYSFP